MNVALFADNTLAIPIDGLVSGLNKLTSSLRFCRGKHRFYIRDSAVSHPTTYEQLPQRASLTTYRLAVPYDNNFFFEGYQNAAIVSFFAWNQLTDLSVTNGLVYFTGAVVVRLLGIGEPHQQNFGCINDPWWDKRGVNIGMRAAFVCPECRASAKSNSPDLADLDIILDLLSRASRMGRDVVEFLTIAPPQGQQRFDIFLCHNSQDKPGVREINAHLRQAGLRTWLDEEQLPLGRPWQVEIEKCISDIRTATVFVGDSGFGPWQDMEMRALLSQLVRRGIPVIPVILPSAAAVPELPLFLQEMTWLDHQQAKKAARRSAAYLRDIAYRLGGFTKAFNVEVRQLSPQDVADYLGDLKLRPRGFNNHVLMLRTFFGFCQSRGWLSKDVDLLSRVEKRSGASSEIEIFTPEELRKLLRAAPARVATCIAIQAFAGVRTAELFRLSWHDIERRRDHIEIVAGKAKTASRRLIPISDNLATWLREADRHGARVWPVTASEYLRPAGRGE